MKRYAAVILCLMLVLILVPGLASCGKKPADPVSGGMRTDKENDAGAQSAEPDPVTRGPSERSENDADSTAPDPVETEYAARCAYANWTEDRGIYTECLNSDAFAELVSRSGAEDGAPRPASEMIGGDSHLPLFLFGGTEELELFRNRFDGILSMEHGYDEVPSFDEAVSDIDEAFFSEKSLLLVYVPSSSGSFRYGITKVDVKEGTLCLIVEKTNAPEAYTADMAGWFLMAEVEKSLLEGLTGIDAVYTPDPAELISCVSPEPVQLPGMIEYGSFSFKEAKKAAEGRPGVRTAGFVNTEETEPGWPVDKAKAELTVEADLAQTFYDEEEDVWMVHFFSSGTAGGDQTVYMNGRGVTLLIVYGE